MNYFRTLAKNGNWPKSEIIYYPFNIKKNTFSRSEGTFQGNRQPKFPKKCLNLINILWQKIRVVIDQIFNENRKNDESINQGLLLIVFE